MDLGSMGYLRPTLNSMEYMMEYLSTLVLPLQKLAFEGGFPNVTWVYITYPIPKVYEID